MSTQTLSCATLDMRRLLSLRHQERRASADDMPVRRVKMRRRKPLVNRPATLFTINRHDRRLGGDPNVCVALRSSLDRFKSRLPSLVVMLDRQVSLAR